MTKVLIATVLAGLALAAPAAAKQGQEIKMSPEVSAFTPGGPQTMVVTLVRVSDTGGAPRERPLPGVPLRLVLENVDTHREVVAVGTATDARGRSRISLTTPASGSWRPTVLAGRESFALPTRVFGAQVSAAPAGEGSSFPWLPVSVGGALVLVLAGGLARRARHPRPRLGGVG